MKGLLIWSITTLLVILTICACLLWGWHTALTVFIISFVIMLVIGFILLVNFINWLDHVTYVKPYYRD